MTLKHFFKTFLFFSFLSFSVFAQKNFVLSGQIVDLAGKTIPNGTVKLLDTNSEIVKAVQVKEGVFSIESVPEGRYLLNTSSIGFNDDIKNIILNRDTSLILIMVDNSTLLNEVQISGTKQNFSNSKGNIKVNIENTILSQVPSAIELLSKLPAVQLSPDGEKLSIVGRGDPLIYLDNQRITLNDLNSLATNDIKTIEIVHNPSSKYEAEGRSVIIITRNKSTADGSIVTLSTTNSFKRNFHSRNGLNVNIKKDRLEFKGNMQYNYLNLWESNSNDFNITDEDIATKYRVYSIDTRRQTIINGGLYYQLNETDYLSANVSKRYQGSVFTNTTDTYIKQPESEDFIHTIINNKEVRPLFNSNVNFNKKFKEQNGQIFLGVQYAQFSHDLASNIYNNYNETETVLSQDRKQNYGVDVVSARADFDKLLKNEMKVEIGANFSSAASNSILKQTDYMPALHLASDFAYEEQISSAYTQVSGKIKRANFSAGLRMENTNVNGTGGAASLMLKKNYTDFFPKATFDFPLTDGNLSVNYAKSIVRPNYTSMSQITAYINPFFEWANNINIKPTIQQEVSATLQVKDNSIGLTYYRVNNPVYYAVEYNEENRKLRMINTNYESESGLNLNIIIPFKSSIWTSTNTITGIINKVNEPMAVINKIKPYVYLYSNNEIKLPAGYTLMISGWGMTKREEGIFERNAMYAIDTAVSKTFFKKLNATLSFNSLLSSQEAKENFTVNSIISQGIYFADVREISLGLKYAFGNIKDSKYKNKEIDENMNRIR
ncbi:outer membrane beta-barrel protein [Pedobacter sp.]|uniref:outer membrane beta-barrel protein n=1 Tax=Pedobacter sp. TaxID=1411316 RepID=UPI003D7F7E4C